MGGGDHQAEVGDVGAGRVRVARDREPPDELAVLVGDEQRGVRRSAASAGLAALVADAAPARVGEQPTVRLAADRARQRDEARLRRRACARRRRMFTASTTTPGAASTGIAGCGERAVRPHLDGGRAAEEEISAPPADDVVAERLEGCAAGEQSATHARDEPHRVRVVRDPAARR